MRCAASHWLYDSSNPAQVRLVFPNGFSGPCLIVFNPRGLKVRNYQIVFDQDGNAICDHPNPFVANYELGISYQNGKSFKQYNGEEIKNEDIYYFPFSTDENGNDYGYVGTWKKFSSVKDKMDCFELGNPPRVKKPNGDDKK